MATAKLSDLPTSDRKIIRAWCMYDWANSAFATSGIVAIFPVYFVFLFKDALGDEAILWGFTFTGSSVWSLAAASSTAIVAITTPILGIIADRIAAKKILLWTYTIVGASCTILTFFSAYTPFAWIWLLITFGIGNIGFAGSLVFYNSFLPHIAPRNLSDEVSSRGFAYGYVGGGLLLLIHLILNLLLSESPYVDLITRFSLASIGVWWFGWALWTFKVLPEPPTINRYPQTLKLTAAQITKFGFTEIANTLRDITRFREILIYLVAYLLFNDGLQTVMGLAGAFAADTLHIPLAFNMATILIIQFVAAGGAMLFSVLARHTTTKNALYVSLIGWVFIVLFGIALVPLSPADTQNYDYRLEYVEARGNYFVTSAPDLTDSRTDQAWSAKTDNIEKGSILSKKDSARLLTTLEYEQESRYSGVAINGPIGGRQSIGISHPSLLGEGPIDWWPSLIRSKVWAPLSLGIGYQWLLLGLFVGMVMGGSQALARSLFTKISPETRSGEFFSFFGFMSRASSVFGPLLYVFVTGVLDTRSAILSILVIIIAGTLVLRWVNVESGIKTAIAEDIRVRKLEN
jgi:UMF1 family MFS transporter